MGIERHRVLLAVDRHGVPCRRGEVGGRQAHLAHVVGGDLFENILAYRQRDAAGMVGHDVCRLTDGGRGLHLGVEGRAPLQRRGVDLDLAGMGRVEIGDHLLHAHAVTAAEEIPPYDGFFGLCRSDPQTSGRNHGGGHHPAKVHLSLLPSTTVRSALNASNATPNRYCLQRILRYISDSRIRLVQSVTRTIE